MKNSNLHSAKRAKNDEFYTQLDDVINEVKNYLEQLRDKPILCPCDWDFNELSDSQRKEFHEKGFVKGINDNFAFSRYLRACNEDTPLRKGYNLKLYFSHYNPTTNEGIKFEDSIREFAKKHPDGVVISNPPFSEFRKFIEIIMKYNLKFLIIGNKNAITYKEVFKYIKENKLWLGYHNVKQFREPNNNFKTFGNIGWFTNLDVEPRHLKLILSESFYENPTLYPKYDNYDAINVDKVKDIPYDYEGYMGVPITFLDKYNPEQFEIYGIANSARYIGDEKTYCLTKINGKKIYNRLIIKNKNPIKGEIC